MLRSLSLFNIIPHTRVQMTRQCKSLVGGAIANDLPIFRVDSMSYSGVKDSGFSREGMHYAIREMTEPTMLVLEF